MLDVLLNPGGFSLGLTGLISLALWVVLLGVKGFALVEALRYADRYYPAAGKRTKNLWLVITGLSLVLHLITGPINFLNVIGTVGTLVFLFDVRPALQQVSGHGGGSRQGPYGPW